MGHWDVDPMVLLGCRLYEAIALQAEESEVEESEVEESKHYRSPSEVEESIPYNFSSGSPTTL
jgi:hypothetical protein